MPLVTWILKGVGATDRLFPEVMGYWFRYMIQAVDIIPAMLIA